MPSVARDYGAKYPLTSTITSLSPAKYTLTAPPVPAGTIAALATTRPVNEFKVDTFGWLCPVGQSERYGNGPSGTTVTFSA